MVSILPAVEMQHKSSHEKATSAKLTFVVLSDAEKPSRTFKASRLQLLLIVLCGFVIIGAVSVVAMIETPLGKMILPEYFSTQAEQLERVKALENKVGDVQQQLAYLASYDMKLRNALGDSGAFSDTSSLRPLVSPEVSKNQTSEGADQVQHTAEINQTEMSNVQGSESDASTSQQMPFQAQAYEGSSLFPLLMPAQGFITRSVDYSIQHYGLDISAPEGESIVAPAAGEVLFADWTLTGGNTLIIAHANDYITVYKHCERILVSVGRKVSRGEAIGLVGSTGVTSTGPHLHFELWQNGRNLNPENYLLTKN